MLSIGFGKKDVKVLPCVERVTAMLCFEGHSVSGPSLPKHYYKRLVTWPRWQAKATARESGTGQQLRAAKRARDKPEQN